MSKQQLRVLDWMNKNLLYKGQQSLCFPKITHLPKLYIYWLNSTTLSPSGETERGLIEMIKMIKTHTTHTERKITWKITLEKGSDFS